MVERAVDIEEVEDRVTFFTGLFAELELDRAVVEVFQEGNLVQRVLSKSLKTL